MDTIFHLHPDVTGSLTSWHPLFRFNFMVYPVINSINAFNTNPYLPEYLQFRSAPVADFDADDTNGCAPFTVHYSDESENGPTSWSWTFQGGTPATSTQQNPTVVYNNPGTFDVSLTVSNAQGSNTLNRNDYITVGVFREATLTTSDELFRL